MRHHVHGVLLWTLILLAFPLTVATAADPTGFWLNQDRDGVVQIRREAGQLSGRIVWLKQPNFPADDPSERAGKPRRDIHNPDPTKRNRANIGLKILWGFTQPDNEGVYRGGNAYDPRNGRTYSGTLQMKGNDKLDLRGYVLISLIGRTATWTRIDPARYGIKKR